MNDFLTLSTIVIIFNENVYYDHVWLSHKKMENDWKNFHFKLEKL